MRTSRYWRFRLWIREHKCDHDCRKMLRNHRKLEALKRKVYNHRH